MKSSNRIFDAKEEAETRGHEMITSGEGDLNQK